MGEKDTLKGEKYTLENIVGNTRLLFIKYSSGFLLGVWEIKENKLQAQLSRGIHNRLEG